MIEVMKDYGGINYKVPHMGKNKLMRNDDLPLYLECERDVVERALAHLQQ